MADEEWVNTKTGEVLSFKVRRVAYPPGVAYVILFQRLIGDIADNNALPKNELRVLLKLLSTLSFENWIAISQETIAQEMGLDRSDVSRAIKTLRDLKLLDMDHDPGDKRRRRYRLSEELAWRGDATAWARRRAQRTGENVVRLPERT